MGTQEPTAVLASLHAAHGAVSHFRAVRAAPAPTWDFPSAPRFLLKGFGPLQHLGRNPAPGHRTTPKPGVMGELHRDSRRENSFLDLILAQDALSSMWDRRWGPSELVQLLHQDSSAELYWSTGVQQAMTARMGKGRSREAQIGVTGRERRQKSEILAGGRAAEINFLLKQSQGPETPFGEGDLEVNREGATRDPPGICCWACRNPAPFRT